MPTLSKSQSARANGAKSHGPKTEAGKQRSSQNAIKHGLTSQTLVLPSEDPADFQRLLDSYLQQFRPAGPVELDLVHEIVAAKWRLNRITLIETQLLAAEIEDIERDNQENFSEGDAELLSPVQSLAKAFGRLSARSLPFLYRLESRLERTYSRALRTLLQLQKPHPPAATRDPHPHAARRPFASLQPDLTTPARPQQPASSPSGSENENCTNEPTTTAGPIAAYDPPDSAPPAPPSFRTTPPPSAETTLPR